MLTVHVLLHRARLVGVAVVCLCVASVVAQTSPPQVPTPVVPPTLPNANRVVGLFPSPEGGGTLYRCLFDRTFDLTGDLWPDGWTRKSGVDNGVIYPNYVPMEIVETDSPVSAYAFHVGVSGGAAAAFSPRIPIRPGMEYSASTLVKATGLTRDCVFMTLAFFDNENPAPLAVYTSSTIEDAKSWTLLTVPPAVATDSRVAYAILGLCVAPRLRQDYKGDVYFTGVTLEENPYIVLTTDQEATNPSHLFFSPRDINIDCCINGVPPGQKSATIVACDHFDRPVASRDVDLEITPVTEIDPISNQVVIRNLTGKGVWQSVPLTDPGFYTFRTTLRYYDHNRQEERTLRSKSQPFSLAILEPAVSPVGSEFGWTLAGQSPQEIASRLTLLGQAGVGRLKIPLWLSSTAPASDWGKLRDSVDWLTRRQIELVGLLYPPPAEVTAAIKIGGDVAAAVFTEPSEVWFPTIQPALLQFTLLMKYWQLGNDSDRSLAEVPNLEKLLEDVRGLFNTIGYDVGLGFGWDWSFSIPPSFRATPIEPSLVPIASADIAVTSPLTLYRVTPAEVASDALRRDTAREFVQLSSDPALTPAELAVNLQRGRDSTVLRWVGIQPLPMDDYTTQDRVNDLVDSMLMAKIHRADAAFCPTPFDDVHGLLKRDGTPAVLFLPWRTTALQLHQHRFIGSVRLPQRSRNFIFEGPNESCMMVVSNPNATLQEPIQEVLYLGEAVEEIELWGLKRTPPKDRGNQVITVGAVPSFVTGLDRNVVLWRQTLEFAKTEIPSFIGQRNNDSFRFINPSNEAVNVRVNLVMDDASGIQLSPALHSFMLQPGEQAQRDFVVTISPTTPSGRHPVRADVTVEGLQTLRFSVYDDFYIGKSDLSMSFLTRLTRRGELEVLQNFTNEGEDVVSYRFVLYVPGRPMERTRVLQQGPGRNDQSYTLPRGQELLGQEIIVRGEPIPPSPGQPLLYKFRAVAY
ncbi:MAG: hypothetical protein ACRC46_04180 [Thermoguttaceae bacterium]